tara:strand:+ start:7945 stop:8451 length:507 start_codon:yes stop_codon:yes gene_type:complete
VSDNIDDLLNLVEIDEKETEDLLPTKWSESDPIAKLTISVINNMFEDKVALIKRQTKKSELKPAKVTQIVKSEVADSVGKSRTFLFSDKKFKYARKIKEYIQQKEKELERYKVRRIASLDSNLKSKTKSDLIKVAQERKAMSSQTADELWTKFINETPIDIKRKLGLM